MAEGAAGADEVRRGEGVERHLPANEPFSQWAHDPALLATEAGDRLETQEVLVEKLETIKLANLIPPIRFESGDKEVLTIEGNGRTDAEIWYQTVPGQPRTYTSARKLRYWIREGTFDGEGFNQLDVQQLSPRLKLPGTRLPGSRR
jgi:hypothetical protein